MATLLERSHADNELQDWCRAVQVDLQRYLILDHKVGQGQRYVAAIAIPEEKNTYIISEPAAAPIRLQHHALLGTAGCRT
jgi:hypothetical protein